MARGTKVIFASVQTATSELPSRIDVRCQATTHSGALCRSPPLRGSPVCWFHSQDPAVSEARDRARGKGERRQRVLAPLAELPPLAFETAEQVTQFETEVLRRLL